MFDFTPGNKLPNGATIIDSFQYGENELIVIAISHSDYVTWHANAHDGQTFWGNYFHENLKGAVQDYEDRLNKVI